MNNAAGSRDESNDITRSFSTYQVEECKAMTPGWVRTLKEERMGRLGWRFLDPKIEEKVMDELSYEAQSRPGSKESGTAHSKFANRPDFSSAPRSFRTKHHTYSTNRIFEASAKPYQTVAIIPIRFKWIAMA